MTMGLGRGELPIEQGSVLFDVDVSAADYTYTDAKNQIRPFALFVGTGGNIELTAFKGGKVVLKNVQDGSFLPVLIKTVHTGANTTALDLVGMV